MKHSKWAATLAIVLCAAALLSGTLLVLHADHACCGDSCRICPVLARCLDVILGMIAVISLTGILTSTGAGRQFRFLENRFVPDWTLVRLKVKLLN